MDLTVTIAVAAALGWAGAYLWELERYWPGVRARLLASGRYEPDFVRKGVNIVRGMFFALGALCLFGMGFWLSVRL